MFFCFLGVHVINAKEGYFMFMDEVLDMTVSYTNKEARRVISGNPATSYLRKVWVPVQRKDIDAFVGLRIIGGALKAHYRSTASPWSEREGMPCFRATMSQKRFLLIKRFFRLDDRRTRDPND